MTDDIKVRTKGPLMVSKSRKRKRSISVVYLENHLRDCSSESSIHGVPYLGNSEHSTCGRAFWMITVCIALICTSYQVVNLYNQWVDDPVVTTLKTISLPVEDIDFPAVTLCPQGSTEDIIDNFFYRQFEEWLINQTVGDVVNTRRKRLAENTSFCECHLSSGKNMTADDLQCCFWHFLDENFPGIYPNIPTEMASMLNTESPDKTMETKAVGNFYEEPKCDENDNSEILNTMNQKLQRKCSLEKLDIICGTSFKTGATIIMPRCAV